MKLSYNKKSKDPIYYIQQGIRNGKKTTTRNIARIGKHSELLKITDDPLAYAKQEVALYNEKAAQEKITMDFKIDFTQKVESTNHRVSQPTSLNIGYFVLQHIYHTLNVKQFFQSVQKEKKASYDFNMVNRFLTFARILDPTSKQGTFDKLSTYFEQPSFAYQHILRFMDVLSENREAYLEHLFKHSQKVYKRDMSVCYFDCTNYYFEIEEEDEEYVDPVTGEVMKGLRKYGISKQHQPSPIVQMGLFMDKDGIPITMSINSGSDNEQKSTIPLEKELVKMCEGKGFIYCADAGLGSTAIRKYNAMGGRRFVVTQSIKKLSHTLKEAVFNDFDYKLLSNDKPVSIKAMRTYDRFDPKYKDVYQDTVYKRIPADNLVDLGLYEEKMCKNGNMSRTKAKGNLEQTLVITFSRKVMEYQRYVRNKQIERARKLVEKNRVDKSKKGANDVRRFIKRTQQAQDGGRVKTIHVIDENKIREEEKYDGFYAIATNLEDDVQTILAINARRYKIEDCFRILKTHFDARPIYHRLRQRIHAHFLICFTALLIFRLLEKKLDAYGTHFTTDEIQKMLQCMNVINNKDVCYEAIYSGSELLSALNGIFDLNLNNRYHQPKVIRKIIKNIS